MTMNTIVTYANKYYIIHTVNIDYYDIISTCEEAELQLSIETILLQ